MCRRGGGTNFTRKFSKNRIGRRSGTGLDWSVLRVGGLTNHNSGDRLYVGASLSRVRVQRLCSRARARLIVPPYDLTGACGVSGCGRNAHVVDAPQTADWTRVRGKTAAGSTAYSSDDGDDGAAVAAASTPVGRAFSPKRARQAFALIVRPAHIWWLKYIMHMRRARPISRSPTTVGTA